MESIACSLCGSTEAREFATVPDLLLDKPEIITRLVQCDRCGLVYQSPRPTLDEIGAHYPPDYEPYADVHRTAGWLLRRAYDHGAHKRRRFVSKAMPKGGRLLDIGCATGTFLVSMRELSIWRVEGVGLDAQVAQLARERHHLPVFTGTLEEAAYPDNNFAAVTLWDVLEHLHDPVGTLIEIERILQPGGVVIIRVPNLGSWDAAFFGNYWAGLDAPRHLAVYTRATLARSLLSGGLLPESFSTAIGSYVMFVLNVRFWMNACRVSPATKRIVAKLLLNPASRLLSAPLFYVPSALGVGPALVAVGRKPLGN